MMSPEKTKFAESIKTRSEGFQMYFADGFKLSIGTGSRHYCDNSGNGIELGGEKATSTMEVALMNSMDDFVVLPDDVAGWVPVTRLADIIQAVSDKRWNDFENLCTATEESSHA
tara:strand:+ start:1066 stop:1407 length:342 start_codon:yes stop_codon:yes gene_type:complete